MSMAGCANTGTTDDETNDSMESISYRDLISRNQENINKLSLGMSRADVERIMGKYRSRTSDSSILNPYKVEPLLVKNDQYLVLYYLTRKYPPFTPIRESQATPVIMKDDKLFSWGWNNLKALRAGNL